MFSRLGASLLLLPLAWVMFPQDQPPKLTTLGPLITTRATGTTHSSSEITNCALTRANYLDHQHLGRQINLNRI